MWAAVVLIERTFWTVCLLGGQLAPTQCTPPWVWGIIGATTVYSIFSTWASLCRMRNSQISRSTETVLTYFYLPSSFVNHSHSHSLCFCNTASTNTQHVWETIIENRKKSILGVGIAPVPPECPTLCLSWPQASWGGPQSSQSGYYHPNFYDTDYPTIRLLKAATSM